MGERPKGAGTGVPVRVPRGRRVRLPAVPAVLAVALLGGSCSFGGAQEPPTPQGFERASVAGMSFAYPQEWRRLDQQGGQQGGQQGTSQDWPAVAGRTSGGQTVVQVAVNSDMPDTGDPLVAVERAVAGASVHLPGFERLGNQQVDVETGQAHRVEYLFYLESQQPGDARKGGYASDVALVDDSGRVVVVRVSGLRAELEGEVADQIAASIAWAD